MKRSQQLSSALALAAIGSAAAYLFATRRGGELRATARDGGERWIGARRDDVQVHLDRIEHQIDALGDELRRRLDTIQGSAARAVAPPIEGTDPWHVEPGDLRDLRGLPGRG